LWIATVISVALLRPFLFSRRQQAPSKQFSIHLDTCPDKEQYEFVVSLFEAKLPLLSPFEVSLKDKLRIERQQGRTYKVLFISSRGAYLLFDVQVTHPDASCLKPHRSSQLATSEKKVRVFKKEIHHV
jgi:hypothetical protein